MEFEEEDLYDCEVYTQKVIDSQDEEEIEDEQKPLIYLCTNCGFVYNVDKPLEDYKGRKIKINDYFLKELPGYFRCPVCSKIVPYALISEEEYETIIEANKKKETKREKERERKERRRKDVYFRINVAKFNHSLIELQKDLEDELYNDKITPDRFSRIYIKSASKLYDKYSKIFEKADRSFPAQEFRAIIKLIDKNIVSQYKKEKGIETKFDEQEEEINDEITQNDELYLKEKAKFIDEEKLYSEDLDEEEFIRQEKLDDAQKDLDKRHQELLEQDEAKLKDLARKRESESKRNEKAKDKLSDINKGRIDSMKKSINIKNN